MVDVHRGGGVAAGYPEFFGAVYDLFHHLFHFGMHRLTHVSHRRREIVRSDEKGVDPGRGENLLQVLHGFDRLDLDHDVGFLVGGADVFCNVASGDVEETGSHAADAHGWILGGANGVFGLRAVVDPGDDQPFGADIQRLLDMYHVVPGHAYERGDIPVPRRLDHRVERFRVRGSVFGIEPDPVEPHVRNEFNDVGTRGSDGYAVGHFAVAQLLFQPVFHAGSFDGVSRGE